MAQIRIATENVGARLAHAAIPVPAVNPLATSGGAVRFAASPALALPSPNPMVPRKSGNLASVQPSEAAPDRMLRRMDVPFADNMQPVVAWVIHNEIPLPAAGALRLPKLAAKPPPRIGGRAVIPQPPNPQRWPSITAQAKE